MKHSAIVLLGLVAFVSAAAAEGGPEYRLEVRDGRPFKTADGKAFVLGPLPFMTGKDFARAVAVKSTNPNQPGSYNVELLHSATGKAKFRAVADADRARSYCAVVADTVRFCAAFPPAVKDVYDRAGIIPGLSKADADTLVAEINRSLKK